MNVIVLYNVKGGVGKTTTAVNLAYLAAASGQRTLLWDLDPQAASSFAFRVRPRVPGFGRKSLQSGRALASAIKQTDYDSLDLLPADFAYRKLDRLLGGLGKPKRVVTELLETLGCDYDFVFLDCPAGFSLLTESVFAAADTLLVPTIPTVLSLRTLGQVLEWADRSASTSDVAAFFSMVDRRKSLHSRTCGLVGEPRRHFSDGTSALRERRGADGDQAYARRRVRRARPRDDSVRRNLGGDTDPPSPARRIQGWAAGRMAASSADDRVADRAARIGGGAGDPDLEADSDGVRWYGGQLLDQRQRRCAAITHVSRGRGPRSRSNGRDGPTRSGCPLHPQLRH